MKSRRCDGCGFEWVAFNIFLLFIIFFFIYVGLDVERLVEIGLKKFVYCRCGLGIFEEWFSKGFNYDDNYIHNDCISIQYRE